MSERIIDKLADRILSLEQPIYIRPNDRFACVSVEETTHFVNDQQNVNTKRITESHVRLLKDWLNQQEEMRPPEQIEPKSLDIYLAQFLLGVRKTVKDASIDNDDIDGQYEPSTMIALHSSIHRYLAWKSYGFNIKDGECFRHSRDVLKAKLSS